MLHTIVIGTTCIKGDSVVGRADFSLLHLGKAKATAHTWQMLHKTFCDGWHHPGSLQTQKTQLFFSFCHPSGPKEVAGEEEDAVGAAGGVLRACTRWETLLRTACSHVFAASREAACFHAQSPL